jgi:type VI secretion system protein ImpJ
MAEARSLCRIDWKLGQALMPDHFLWQEDSLRREVEMRAAHQALPRWGLVELGWDEALLRATGRLLINRLELVFETGALVDIPGNARPVSLDLPKPGLDPIDVYVHLSSEPEIIKGGWSDREGSLIELRMQKLALATEPLRTPLPGFRLLRLVPCFEGPENKPNPKPTGWILDGTYAPPSVDWLAFRPFGMKHFQYFHRTLERWIDKLRGCAVENALGVHKRVEASLYLRRALGLSWYLRQIAPVRLGHAGETRDARAPSDPNSGDAGGPAGAHGDPGAPAVRAHPFELYSRLVGLYLDVFTFRCGPLQALHGEEPQRLVYEHEALGRCFDDAETALDFELNRPGAGSAEWSFTPDPKDAERMLCVFPEVVSAHTEMYFIVQFDGGPPGGESGENDVDTRMDGLKLAAPARLEVVHRRVLPGIPLERVRMLPFPHDFDANTVQFYRLKHGPEWALAHAAGAIAYQSVGRKLQRAFLFSPDLRA